MRVALWVTAAWAGQVPLEEVPRRAMPDLDEVDGLLEPVRLWGQLGERALLVALPRPGDLSGMPRGSADLLAAATRAEECVYVPGVGGALVPTFEEFGPEGDRGWLARWETFASEPVPTHRVEALDLSQVELGLRTGLSEQTEALAGVGATPFGAAAETGARRARAAVRAGTLIGDWGLPDGIPGRAARVIDLAGTVLRLADAGLEPGADAADASSTLARAHLLRTLQAQAARALADATNAAVLALAGWR